MGGVDSPNVVNIADLRDAAKRRLPRVVFDYIDGGADAEWTMRENSRVFDDVTFRPRSAVATSSVDLRTTVLGSTIDLPFLLAPVGSSRLFYPRGEEVAARAAEMPARSIRSRRCRAATFAMSRLPLAGSCGISSISSEAATWPRAPSSGRNRAAVPRSSLP